MERKMAVIKRVDKISSIPDAEFIELAHIGGWKVVVKKGEHKEGSLVVYCEIDGFIPTALAPFLTKVGHSPKEYNWVLGERLKTVKLRGQISQGLILPVSILGCVVPLYFNESDRPCVGVASEEEDSIAKYYFEGDDVTDFLGIQKYEIPEYAGKCLEAKGNFPSFLKKTDQERVQNIKRDIQDNTGDSFEVTVKRDGSSCTIFVKDVVDGVCSRNIELKDVEGNAFWDIAKANNIHEKLRLTGRNLAAQGELLAANIQGGYEKVNKPEWHCFNIWDIDKQEYLLPKERRQICADLCIPHIAVVDEDFILDHSCDELLKMAEGDGVNPGVRREGLVFKSNTSQFSFKAVSNEYLIKQK